MIPVTIENTLGAQQVGVVVAIYLFGIVTLQFHYYVQTFEDDKRGFRILALTLWILELAHTICICAEMYRGTIVYSGDMDRYTKHPFMGVATLLGGLITMLVHIFFCLRVWKALPNPFRYIGVVCGVTTVLRAVGGVYLGIRVIRSNTLAEYREANGWLVAALLAAGAAIDLVIAASMLYFLVSKREKGMGQITTLIDRLVAYTIRSGFLTSVTAVAVLITFQLLPETFIWVAFYVVLAKLYSNSLFSALNERERLRKVIAGSHSSEKSDLPRTRQRHLSEFQDIRTPRPEISIEMQTTVVRDDEEKVSPFSRPESITSDHLYPIHGSRYR